MKKMLKELHGWIGCRLGYHSWALINKKTRANYVPIQCVKCKLIKTVSRNQLPFGVI